MAYASDPEGDDQNQNYSRAEWESEDVASYSLRVQCRWERGRRSAVRWHDVGCVRSRCVQLRHAIGWTRRSGDQSSVVNLGFRVTDGDFNQFDAAMALGLGCRASICGDRLGGEHWHTCRGFTHVDDQVTFFNNEVTDLSSSCLLFVRVEFHSYPSFH
jgi:hypothetical protein